MWQTKPVWNGLIAWTVGVLVGCGSDRGANFNDSEAGAGGRGGDAIAVDAGLSADTRASTPDTNGVLTDLRSPGDGVMGADVRSAQDGGALVADAGLIDAATDAIHDSASTETGAGPALDPCGGDAMLSFFDDAVESEDGRWTLRGSTRLDGVLRGSCGGEGGEIVVRFDPPFGGAWYLDTEPEPSDLMTFDTVLYARTVCDDPTTETACNDDLDPPARLTSRIVVLTDEQETLYVVVDAFRLGGNFALTAGVFPILQAGDGCDPRGESNRCITGTFCFVEPVPAGAPLPELGSCVTETAPEAIDATAYRDGERLVVTVDGRDSSRDVVAMVAELRVEGEVIPLDPAGEQTHIELDLIESVYGQAEFRVRALATLPELPEAADSVLIHLRDGRGLQSAPLERNLGALPLAAYGEACDEARVRNRCPDGTSCARPPDGHGEPRCAGRSAPTITTASVFINAHERVLGLEMSGQDAENDVVGFGLRLLTHDGEPIDLGVGADLMDIVFDEVEQSDGQFVGRFVSMRGGIDVARIGVASADVYDRDQLRSAPVDVPVVPSPRVDVNESCDPARVFNLCADALACQAVADPEAQRRCSEPIGPCPEDWRVVELNEERFVTLEGWAYHGDNRDRANLTAGTCGGRMAETVLAFTPPADGVYRFVTQSEVPHADTVLYLRSHCRYSEPHLELACADDDGDTTLASTVVELVGGDTVYVFIDGDPGWEGGLSLRVLRE